MGIDNLKNEAYLLAGMRQWRVAPFLLGFAIALVAGGVMGVQRLDVIGEQQDDTGGRYRWRNVEITLPDSGVAYDVLRTVPFSPENDRYLIQVSPLAASGQAENANIELRIDAETGETLFDSLTATYAADAKLIIDSIRVDPSPPKVWPYEGELTSGRTLQFERVTYPEPEPASGILISYQYGECVEPGCSSAVMIVENGTSQLRIDGRTGGTIWEGVRAADAPAFSRFVSAIEVSAASPTSGDSELE